MKKNKSPNGTQEAPPVFDEAGAIVAGPAPAPGAVEANEARLPESTQVSWMMSSKAWRAFIGRFTPSAKA
jgi:hypothetical protein